MALEEISVVGGGRPNDPESYAFGVVLLDADDLPEMIRIDDRVFMLERNGYDFVPYYWELPEPVPVTVFR